MNINQGSFVSAFQRAQEADKAELADKVNEGIALAETEQDTIKFAQSLITPRNALRLAKPLSKRSRSDRVEAKKQGTGESSQLNRSLKPEKDLKDTLRQHKESNDELDEEKVMQLLHQLSADAKEGEILAKLQEIEKDPYIASTMLEAVVDCCKEGTALRQNAYEAAAQYREAHGREIQIGQNIADQVKEFTVRGLGSSRSELRSWYRDAVDTVSGPVKTAELFLKMLDRFGAENLVKATHFFLVSLGSDLRNRGIDAAALTDKVHQVRVFQAITNVFRMCSMRMRVVPKALEYYAKQGFPEQLPKGFDYRDLGRTLMSIVQNRHLNKDIIVQTVRTALLNSGHKRAVGS